MKNQITRIFCISILLAFIPKVVIGTTNADTLSEQRYVDPKGYFTIVPPAGWRIQEYPNDNRGKVAFLSPAENIELRILVAAVDFDTIEGLIYGSKNIEKRIGKSTNIEKVMFYGRQAIKRSFEFNGVQLLVYDFLIGNIHYNIQYGAPPSNFSKLKYLAEKSMETYEATYSSGNDKEILEHSLAGKRRLAQLAIKLSNLKLAAEYVREGLDIDSSDTKLKELNVEIEKLKNTSTKNTTLVKAPQNEVTKEKKNQEESKPEDVYVAAVVGPLAVLVFVIWGIELMRKKEEGIFPLALVFGGLTFGGIVIGDGIKAEAYLPVAIAIVIFISGFAFWFFRLKK